MPPKSNGCVSCFFVTWVLGWTAVVLPFDAMLGWALARQVRALAFPTTEGMVTRSGVKADGDTHRLDLAYDYTVGGRRYTGTRYCYSEMGTGAGAWRKVSDGLPVGAAVAVSYDPTDPADALLRPGLTGFHLSMLWFLTPFNVIMLGSWVALARVRREFAPVPTASGWRVRVPGLGPAGCFGAVMLAVTFVGTFAWGFGCGFNPPVWLAGPVYLAAVVVAAGLGYLAERPWFEVDETARVLRLPAVAGTTYEVPFDAIRLVTVTREESRDSDGDVVQKYHCELIHADLPAVRVATYRDSEPADALVAWLREKIGAT